MSRAAELRNRALSAAAAGLTTQAATLFGEAVDLPDADASVLNSAANFFARQGRKAQAIDLLRRALERDPGADEVAVNLAVLLTNDDRAGEALALLVERQEDSASHPRYWSARANAERLLGRRADAFASYEKAVARDPANKKALHGRARMAMETGRAAAGHYRLVLATTPDDAQAWLGFANALAAEGDRPGARSVAEHLVRQNPAWIEALELLAQLRWADGERANFTDHYRSNELGGTLSECRMLAGVDRYADAADKVAARRKQDGSAELALLEAVYRGEAGDDERAEAIFATLDLATLDRQLHEARHRLRTDQAERAEVLLADIVATQPDNVSGWALLAIAWRLLGDPRLDWLCRPDLVASTSLELDPSELARAINFLDALHDGSEAPVGQSIRGGTQTRGGLFDRHEPEAALIERGFRRAVETYRNSLPSRDESHPLLRHRDDRWAFQGSWSIRMFESGRHVPHIHPAGLVSSAAYFAVPPDVEGADRSGWLELGRPPADLRLDLEPMMMIQPEPGKCALFPSFLYHGTRPFAAGKRMSVAIDVNLEASRRRQA